MSLLILGNVNKAVETAIQKKIKDITYSPVYHSSLQKNFADETFSHIKKILPSCKYKQKIDSKEFQFVSGWNAYEEKKIAKLKNATMLDQNTLFESIDFTNIKSFTQFRNKYEKNLPSQFESAYQYHDLQVLDSLNQYFKDEKAKIYFETRNQLIGKDFSTKFSKYLSSGRLNVKFLYNKISEYEEANGSNKSTYWLKFELLWREFFYHSGFYNKEKIFSINGLITPMKFIEKHLNITEVHNLIKPFPLIYASLKELINTGYMSNRMRQIFASFWINDLNQDWYSGARLFEKYLIDYDVFINYGNWQYLAGVGYDPRGQRYFNLKKQLERYDPQNTYIDYWNEKEINI